MSIIYLLIPLSILLVVLAVFAFSWATKNGQFDDLDSPALSILDDELDVDKQKNMDNANNHNELELK